jgi:glyoxylase-like metal-dependent hydrolase (beta-lactamase superfamily II)
VIITHAHTDHFGGAMWLQREAGCEVLLHTADIAMTSYFDSREAAHDLFLPLGFDEELLRRFLDDGFEFCAPDFTPLEDGAVYRTGGTTLRAEHHPGHTAGHVWVVDESSGAIFVGDYVIADHPTNAGLEIDRSQPSGRAPLLEQYNAGLRELADRRAPVLFPAHGPPITDHATLIRRRLAKTDRRTRSVLRALQDAPGVTALELGRRMYRSRAETSWEVISDLVGRLDLLVAEGHATARMGEDGAWHFRADQGGNRDA